MFPKWSDWHVQYTRKGYLKHRMFQTLHILTLAAAIVGGYAIRNDVRGGLYHFVALLRQSVKSSLISALGLVQRRINELSVKS